MNRKILILLLGISVLLGQSAEVHPTFEVVSVKPSAPGGVPFMGLQPGGRFTALQTTLRLLIERAYHIQPYQHEGGPAWMDSEKFDVIGQAGRTVTNDELSEMLKTMLADRFKLRIHRDTHRVDGYALVVAKSGVKIRSARPEAGTRYGVRTFPLGQMTGPASLGQLAVIIGGALRAPVVDRTGLEGYFDFTIHYSPIGANTADQLDSAPNIFVALDDQAGLKLEAEKELADLYVIDSADHPSAN